SLATLYIGGIESPVLVATHVLNIHNMLIVGGPEIEAHTAISIFGHRFIVVFASGANPDVEHIVNRSQIGHMVAIRRDFRTGFDGIAKKHISRDQWYLC